MEFIKVKSSNIDKVAYDEGSLYVEYVSGGLYRYLDVPKEKYDALLESDSKGRFMNGIIKENQKYEKVERGAK